MEKKLYKITLRPKIELEAEYEIRAESKEAAESIGQAHIVRSIAAAFGIDTKNTNIKFS